MIKSNQRQPGDVVIRKSDAGHLTAYALSTIPGPDQIGCATHAVATRLARGYGKHARVDVWDVADTGAVTAVAQFRGLAPRSARPPLLPARGVVWAAQSAWARPAGP